MDYFKQSATRLHFVAEKVFGMTLDMYRQPDELVNELSASGLRHVGYGIPSELCAPFTNAYVSVLRTVTDDEDACCGAFVAAPNTGSLHCSSAICDQSASVGSEFGLSDSDMHRKRWHADASPPTAFPRTVFLNMSLLKPCVRTV